MHGYNSFWFMKTLQILLSQVLLLACDIISISHKVIKMQTITKKIRKKVRNEKVFAFDSHKFTTMDIFDRIKSTFFVLISCFLPFMMVLSWEFSKQEFTVYYHINLDLFNETPNQVGWQWNITDFKLSLLFHIVKDFNIFFVIKFNYFHVKFLCFHITWISQENIFHLTNFTFIYKW